MFDFLIKELFVRCEKKEKPVKITGKRREIVKINEIGNISRLSGFFAGVGSLKSSDYLAKRSRFILNTRKASVRFDGFYRQRDFR